MAMKGLMLVGAAVLAWPALVPAQDASPVQVAGSISAGARGVDNDTNSSKLTEYRDLADDAFVPKLTLDVFEPRSGWYFDFSGANVSLDDQSLFARGGRLGRWELAVDWLDTPHNYSNKAQTPYLRRGPGLLEVGANVPITFKKLATAAADAPGVLASDALVAAYQAASLGPTPLGTDSSFGRVALEYTGAEALRLALAYDRRDKSGIRPGFGPIGDRPPRTLNIQFAEPLDHSTQDVKLSAGWVGRKYQAEFSYLFSDFANRIDTLTWENVFATPAPGATFDAWDRSVSAYGRRPLWPDNRYHNASLSIAGELPLDSRLGATFVYGRLEQNEALLPYSFNADVLANRTLPRATAAAEMTTTQVLLDYVISPAPRLNVRAWGRRYGLDNDTPQANWQYVTSDTSNLNGTVSYKNKRVNLPYASDRTNAGIEATYRLTAGHGSLTVGYERESVDRDFREADTAENRVRASFRARPASGLNLRARYVHGRRGGDYDPFVTRQSYWYAPAEATDQDNPRLTFSNHPDMIRFDVADRRRNEAEVALTLAPRDTYSITASVRYRNDDFDADVRPVQALAGTGVGEAAATSPGDQLGQLEDTRLRYALDAFYMPTERLSLNAFVSWDKGAAFMRSLEYNENNKGNPSSVATAALGPWTRASSQWTADSDDRTWTAGLGATLRLRDRVSLSASYTLSLADFDLAYDGFGVTSFDGTPFPPNHEFAFSSPPTINQDLHLVDARLEFPLVRGVMLVLGYGYERYRIDDWQQGTSLPWVEAVGSEFLLRDTSRSHQWGNRLFNLGSFLAPGYDAHVGWAAFTYRF
jgi:MtrB/PioB family decaheme-associated outer membrane protein